MTPAPTRGTFTHDGIEYDVIDWRYDDQFRRKAIELNSRHAEGRAFVPPEKTQQIRIYLFDRGHPNSMKSDDATYASQFKHSVPARWTR